MTSQTPLQRAVNIAKITDTELARRTGWTSQQICKVRHGKANASRPLALALERELAPHLSADELLGVTPAATEAAQ